MFTWLFWLPLALAVGDFNNGEAKKKPCCDSSSSSSSSSSDDCLPCPRQVVSVESNAGAYPIYYGLPNASYTTGQSFLINSGPYGGYLVSWDCFCAGDKYNFKIEGGEFLFLDYREGVTDNQCSTFEDNSRNCFVNNDFFTLIITLAPDSIFNVTLQQMTAPYKGGSGYLAYFDLASEDDNLVCGESIFDCNLEPYERTYPCDFGN